MIGRQKAKSLQLVATKPEVKTGSYKLITSIKSIISDY